MSEYVAEEQEATAIRELCVHFGIHTSYYDVAGQYCEVSRDALISLLAEFGVSIDGGRGAADTLTALRRGLWDSPLPPVVAIAASRSDWSVRLRLPAPQYEVKFRLTEAGGSIHEGGADAHAQPELTRVDIDGLAWVERNIPIGVSLPPGYHELRVEGMEGHALVVSAPARCHRPNAAKDGRRLWGAAVQLYSLRSERNWGMGDFSDLAPLVEQMSRRGASIIGLNPLHALFPHNPAQVSPYSPSSRQHLNVLYIDVEAIEDFAACTEVRTLVESVGFQARLTRLRESDLIDAVGVAGAKFEALELLFAHFRRHHLKPSGRIARDATGRRFLDFLKERGVVLYRHALFEAIQEHFHKLDATIWGFPGWPAELRNPESPEVNAFAHAHFDRVQYYEYLQWIADGQLAQASRRTRDLGLPVGLYLDIAVSFDRAGSDAWSARDEVAGTAAVGAPPDAFNQAGQNWGLPPLRPDRLRQSRYRLFIDTLRANMRGAGALRIDHVMGLMRLFWIPAGKAAREGTYVGYALDEMMAIVALESQRNHCMVIGEDLGTVEDEMRAALSRFDVLSYRLLYFERRDGGNFLPPGEYPEAALVAVTTHDLPPLAAWWGEDDLNLRESLELFPDKEVLKQQRHNRASERSGLLRALRNEGLLPEAGDEGEGDLSEGVVEAIHSYVAATPSALMMMHIEDVLGVVTQVNLPGTVDEHPNWRRKLPMTLDELARDPRLDRLGRILTEVRPGPLSP